MGSVFPEPFSPRQQAPAVFRRLPILILLISLLALVIAVIALDYAETRLVQATGETLSLAAAEVGDKVDLVLRERVGDARIMASAPVFRGRDRAAMNRFLLEVKASQQPYYLWLGATDAVGRIVAATDPATLGQDRSDAAWYRAVREGAGVHIGEIEPFVDAGGAETLSFTVRLSGAEGEFLGALAARVAVTDLEDLLTQTLRTFRLRENFSGPLDFRFITESGDVVIESRGKEERQRGNLVRLGLPSARLVSTTWAGFVEEEDLDRHVPVVTGFARTGRTVGAAGVRWGILVHMDRSEVLGPVRRDLWRLGGVALLLWMPLLGVLLWVSRKLSRLYAYSQEREEWLATTLGSIGDGVIATDEHGCVLFMNTVAQDLTGWPEPDAQGRRLEEVFRIVNEESRKPVESPVSRVLREGQVVGLANHTVLIRRDGGARPIDDSGAPIRDAQGRLAGVVMVFHDVTARRKAERQRSAEHTVTRLLSEAGSLPEATVGILRTVCRTLEWDLGLCWVVDRSAEVLRCVDSWREAGSAEDGLQAFLEDSRDRIFARGVGLPGRVWAKGGPLWITDVVEDPNFPREQAAARAGLHGAFGFPILLGGEALGVLEFFSRGRRPVDDDLLGMMAAVGRQVGQFIERKEAERELADEKEQLEVTLGSIGEGVIATDADGCIRLINAVAEMLTGWPRADAEGQPLGRVFHILDEKTRQRCVDPVREVLRTGGSMVGFPAAQTILLSKNGEERLLANSGAPIRAGDGRVIGVVLVFRDVTEQMRIERDLMIARKLESVGILAGGIAHDFNNILTAILGNISLVKRDVDSDGRLFRRLSEAESAIQRATGLTKQLLTFSKGGSPLRKISAIGALLPDWATFVLRGTNVRCEYAVPEDLWPVEIDEGQMSQVIHNLVLNARQAMSQGGVIRISGENCVLAGEPLCQRVPLPEGRYVKLTVQDQGVGIAPELLGRIFDPYFTTKAEGSGLGLAMSFSIVKSHDGHITVESQIGIGTMFALYLPASIQSLTLENEPEQRLLKGCGRILIMDDEATIRALLMEMLGQCGYEAVETVDGAQMLQIYREAKEAGEPFAAVIMDLTVPGGMGGLEAIERLRIFDPDVKAILSSGYATDPVINQFNRYGFCGMVVKPYEIVRFSRVLHQVLREGVR